VIRRTKVSSAGSSSAYRGGLLALAGAILLLLGLLPGTALAVTGTQHLDEPPTMGYTTMTVTGEVKADLVFATNAMWEVVEDPSDFDDSPYFIPDFQLQRGEEVRTVQREFTGLKPGTTYYARLKLTRGSVTEYSNVVSGTTLPVPSPQVLSVDNATSVSYTSAHVEGEVEGVEGPDPAFGSDCRFEYVTDAEYDAQDEIQELTVRATGGTFQLYYGGSPTDPIAYDASAATVESALEALPAIGSGNVSVSGGPGNEAGDSPYEIAFQGTLAAADVDSIFVDSTALQPEGQSGADVQTPVGGHPEEGFAHAGSVPCDVNPVTGSGPTPVEADITGLEGGTTYHLRLSMTNAGGSDSEEAAPFTTLAVAPPVVLGVDDAGNVGYTQADLSGEVERPAGADPAFDVNCRFEYVPAQQFLSSGFQGAASTDCAENPVEDPGASPVSAHLSGLGIGTTYYYRLVAVNAGGKDVVRATNTFTTLVPDAPAVSIFPVDTIGAHSARFSGEIDPGGTDPAQEVFWYFECDPACPGAEGPPLPASETPQQVSVEVTGLSANTEYKVTLVAFNAAATASAGPVVFTTAMAEPAVATLPAFTLVGGTEALVGGTVDPENLPTTYWLEYGTDDSYGSSIPVSEDADAGSGDEPVFVQRTLTGLTPGAEYHYRVVAVNAKGSSVGQDKTFVTPTGDLGSSIGDLQLPENRRWEMVSPPDKNGGDIWRIMGIASPSGDRLTYKSQGSFAGQENSKGAAGSDYIAQRSPSGWQSRGITPKGGEFALDVGLIEASENLDAVRFNWRERANESPDEDVVLNPDAQAVNYHNYRRDTATGKFTLLPRSSGDNYWAGWDSSSDGTHYAVETTEIPAGAAPCGTEAANCVYESSDSGATWHLASVLPDESGAEATLTAMSQDGSRIYFRSGGENYVRIDAISTIKLAGGSGTSVIGLEGGDGARALLLSSEQLLGSDTDGGNDLYLWDGAAPEGERLTLISKGELPGRATEVIGGLGFAGGVVGGFALATDARDIHDLDRGFFTAANQVLEGEPNGQGQKIYAWSIEGGEPTLSYVATANTPEFRVSRNGRFLVFATSDRVTAYDNAGKKEVYRYDQETDRLACVSCQPEGKKPTGDGRLQYISSGEEAWGPRHTLRNVTDEGLVFFESLESLASHDSNGKADVYEYVDGLPRLLSKGTGPHESRFVDASVNGDSVFFATEDQLVGWDTDHSYDIYSARIGGGFPEPPLRPQPCEGDACQPAPVPPNDPTPASESFKGAGNVKPHRKKHCKKKAKHCKKKAKHCKKKAKHCKKNSTKKNG
jgi:hypothetical protein